MTFDDYDDFFHQAMGLTEPAGPFDYRRWLACDYRIDGLPK